MEELENPTSRMEERFYGTYMLLIYSRAASLNAFFTGR